MPMYCFYRELPSRNAEGRGAHQLIDLFVKNNGEEPNVGATHSLLRSYDL